VDVIQKMIWSEHCCTVVVLGLSLYDCVTNYKSTVEHCNDRTCRQIDDRQTDRQRKKDTKSYKHVHASSADCNKKLEHEHNMTPGRIEQGRHCVYPLYNQHASYNKQQTR